MTTKTVLGYTFKPMDEQDYAAFAGADEGTLICYDGPAGFTLLLEPATPLTEGTIVEINDETGKQRTYKIYS